MFAKQKIRDAKIEAKYKKEEEMQKSFGKQYYFNLHGKNPFNPRGQQLFEKIVSAPSESYIKKHKSQYVGKNIQITKIDSKIFAHVKNNKQAQKAIQTRHGYHIENGNERVYD